MTALSPDGRRLLFSTYLGGSATEHAFEVARDSWGDIYLAGYTSSPDLSTTTQSDAGPGGEKDVFVTRLTPDAQNVLYSTRFGGTHGDRSYALAVGADGVTHVAGYTYSGDFPVVGNLLGIFRGSRDVIVVQLDADGDPVFRGYLSANPFRNGHLGQAQIDAQRVLLAELELHGGKLFRRRFNTGAAANVVGEPGLPILAFGQRSAPQAEAENCLVCHDQLTKATGATSLVEGGGAASGAHARAGANKRNPRPVHGSAVKGQLAAEMSDDLRDQADEAVAAARTADVPVRFALSAKGVNFGHVVAHPDGELDTSAIAGVDADLVVKPFGAKGTVTDLRSFVTEAAARHLNLRVLAVDSDPASEASSSMLTHGDLTAILYWVATRPLPTQVTPTEAMAREQMAAGAWLFDQVGCGECHVPTLTLNAAEVRITSPSTPEQAVRYNPFEAEPTNGVAGPVSVALFSDLKRHDMGPSLREPMAEAGVGRSIFMTSPLWGVASSGLWLHDGRAASLAEAILWHGGGRRRRRDAISPRCRAPISRR